MGVKKKILKAGRVFLPPNFGVSGKIPFYGWLALSLTVL